MIRSPSPSAPVVVLVVAFIVGACGPGATPSPATTGTPASPTPVATRTAEASAVVSPATSSLPPDASLAAEGGDPIVGQLGSFTWGQGGSDSPWLPGALIAVGAGEPLTVTLGDGTRIGAWTAVRTPADSTTGAGAVEAGEGTGVIGFAIGQPGRWTVAVTMAFVRGGSATWYWQLEVT